MPDYKVLVARAQPGAMQTLADHTRRSLAKYIQQWPADSGASRRSFRIRKNKASVTVSNKKEYSLYIGWNKLAAAIVADLATPEVVFALLDHVAEAIEDG